MSNATEGRGTPGIPSLKNRVIPMKAKLASLNFLIQCQTEKHPPLEEETVSRDIGTRQIEMISYAPRKRSSRCGSPILAVHGMSVLGNRDPRFVKVCRAMAGCGYRVLSPSIREVRDLVITPRTITTLAHLIRAICADREMSPEGRLSLFAPSFSAGLCLAVASRRDIAPLVKSLCAVGAFGNVQTVIENLMGDPEADEYGRLILLKNFLPSSFRKSSALRLAFETAARDNGLQREEPQLPGYLNRLGIRERRTFARLREDAGYRLLHWDRMSRRDSVRKMMSALSLHLTLKHIKASVTLIHGEKDNVIPSSESQNLFTRLRQENIPSRLVLTPLIGHGDARINPRLVGALLELLAGFAFFFETL